VWKWSHYAIVEAVEPFKLHFTSMSYVYKVFEQLKQLWMGIWQHIHTVTTTEDRRFPRFEKVLWSHMMLMWKWSHFAIIETVEPFKLHPISMSYIYKVFEHLEQLWMGIWQQIHTITTTDVSSDLGEFTEIRDDVSVEMIPLRYRWGCRTVQTAFHIHVIYI
jgi:hypothetical protein